jgi:hypothetical protein
MRIVECGGMSRRTKSNVKIANNMPLYYFHLHGSGARDEDGEQFPDDECARKEARAVARDLSKNRNPAGHERIVVTNGKAEVIHEEPLFRR